MTHRARRLYSTLAILLFAISAPAIVLWTSGYRWSGWHSGLTKTGAIYISSEPKANLFVNGVLHGQTPQRLIHLTPGTYTIELQKSGYGVWHRDVKVTPGGGQTLGPVVLFPATFSVTYQTTDTDQQFIAAADQRVIYSVQPRAAEWDVYEVWPSTNQTHTLLPWQPTSVLISPNRQLSIFTSTTEIAVVNRSTADHVWQVPAPASMHWGDNADTLFYGLVDGHIVRFDALKNATEQLSIADSFTVKGDTIWLTQYSNNETHLARQKTFGQAVPDAVVSWPSEWILRSEPTARVFAENTTTHEVVEIQPNTLGTQITTHSLGTVDQLWDQQNNQPPIWLRGNDIITRNADGNTLLVDRTTPPLFSQWLVPYHLLMTADDHLIRIASVSSRQGRGTLLERRFDESISVLGVDVEQRVLVVQTDEKIPRLVAIHW